ncbi:lipid A biosynthesis acyltransferase [Lutibacter sp. TH_r2]|uniref:lysophospholipid acyltransferase family protein n=1 Tax=Lutibacter sp. TH_r2 TaxID=3082083 RepID=UPI00295516DC|nr:lipid A biosynthesis acyltransferase [Lutibacter sp. TH_r2]MDV7188018.1 lipid A biosynthesis acyltransferase [Lutibacter sp. TH_r2]
MDLIIYILVYPLIWIISILPFRILYLFSDFLYVIVYYLVGYRKKVVLDNLKLAFPEKEEKELLLIRKKFYHHFVDVFMEMIKSFTISEKQIYKRYKYTNVDFLNELYNNGKSSILVGAHYANWEWIMCLNQLVKYKGVAAYTKVNNVYLNNAILKSRGKFGVLLKQTSKIIKEMDYNHTNNIQAMYGLLSDQSPQLKKTHYWGQFFGVKNLPIHTGAEMLAKKYDMNFLYMNVEKIKRGYYEITFELITENAKKYANYELTDIFLNKVEKQVNTKPAYYFWTHKRFKHKDKAPTN